MTQPTAEQLDALTELINIGFARTASSLSDLVGSRVMLDAPKVSLHSIRELAPRLRGYVKDEVATVQQIFTGPISGNALLLLNYEGALTLTNLLAPPESVPSRHLDSAACEVLTEIGNILLNACLGVFGNLLQIQISFSVPHLYLDALDGLLTSLTIGKAELRYAMMIYTGFHLQASSVDGYLVMVLGVSSLDSLLAAVDQWAETSVEPIL